jgi:hypothetical protein
VWSILGRKPSTIEELRLQYVLLQEICIKNAEEIRDLVLEKIEGVQNSVSVNLS